MAEKIILVTGASRGIGKSIALTLGQFEQVTVIGTATSDAGAQAISDYLQQADITGQGMVLNVANQESIDQVLGTISEHYGMPSILVNNAAITRDNLFLRMKEQEWDEVITTNLTSVFRMAKACVRPMIKARWGRIINIGSVVGSCGNPGQVNYTAAKAGILGFTKSLALEVASRGITVNAIAPGFVDTDMTQALSEEQRTKLLATIPMGRVAQPQDIADAAAFLASDQAAYMTGQTLHINGGMFMP